LAAGTIRGGDAGGDETGIFPPIAAPRGTLAAGAGAAATAGDVGAVPAIARPDRQDLQDRAPATGAADAGNVLPAPPSDAPPAVDLETGPRDELGLVGRKE